MKAECECLGASIERRTFLCNGPPLRIDYNRLPKRVTLGQLADGVKEGGGGQMLTSGRVVTGTSSCSD